MVIDGPIDESLGVYPVFISLPRRHAVFLKMLLESYEGLAVTRAVEPHYAPERCLLVALVTPDFKETAQRVLSSVETETDMIKVEASNRILEELRHELLSEL